MYLTPSHNTISILTIVVRKLIISEDFLCIATIVYRGILGTLLVRFRIIREMEKSIVN